MSLKAFFILLTKHLTKKWGRVLLSSMGIMIGVWAILLTVTLSTGLSTKLKTAVNSQPLAKTVQFYNIDGIQSIFEARPDTKLKTISYGVGDSESNEQPNVVSYAPSDILGLFVNTNSESVECVNTSVNIAVEPEKAIASQEILNESCHQYQVLNQPFDFFYQTNKTNWIGKTTAPEANEIVVCYRCDQNNPLFEKLDVNSPDELLGKKINVELNTVQTIAPGGKEIDFQTATFVTQEQIKQTQITPLEIVGVIDDRSSGGGLLGGALNSFFFADRALFEKAILGVDETIDPNNVGYVEHNVFIDNFENLDDVIDFFNNKNYLVISTGQILVSSINTAFTVITIILGIFAAIALFAAIFGIVNVMIISVLERRKEIGILKALGATNNDIFYLFTFESIFLGILGWILGWLLALASTTVLSFAFDQLLLSSSDIQENLAQFDITSFDLPIPVYILAATLGLAILFTLLSGLYPSLSAAKQNPTEVLRSE